MKKKKELSNERINTDIKQKEKYLHETAFLFPQIKVWEVSRGNDENKYTI